MTNYIKYAILALLLAPFSITAQNQLEEHTEALQMQTEQPIDNSKSSGCINEDCLADVNFDGRVDGADFSIWLGWNGTEVCPADLNKDGKVNGDDLLIFNAYYTGGATCNACEADIDEDGDVDGDDFAILLGSMGTLCPCSPVDYNLDGYVDGADWSIFLGNYGVPCGKSAANSSTFEALDQASIENLSIQLDNAYYPTNNKVEIEAIFEARVGDLSKSTGCINEDCLADVNFDGRVDGADFSIWLGWNGTEVCPADLNKDGKVNQADYDIFMPLFGTSCTGCEADIDEDGDVDGDDFAILLGNMGTLCPCSPVDYNLDGYVDGADWSIFLANYGIPCGKSAENANTSEALNSASLYELSELLNTANVSVEFREQFEQFLEANKSRLSSTNDLIEISVYPVPADDIITISMSTISSIDMIIEDAQGRIVERMTINSSTQIDVQDLAKGTYSIRDAEGKIAPKQFMVVR